MISGTIVHQSQVPAPPKRHLRGFESQTERRNTTHVQTFLARRCALMSGPICRLGMIISDLAANRSASNCYCGSTLGTLAGRMTTTKRNDEVSFPVSYVLLFFPLSCGRCFFNFRLVNAVTLLIDISLSFARGCRLTTVFTDLNI